MDAAVLTKKLVSENTAVIYEATFIYNGVLIMVDILTLENGVYTAYEVKSSIKISETYLRDGCLQYYVLKNSLEGFDDLYLTTLNGDYVFDGTIDPKKLFKKRSVKKDAEKNLAYFDARIADAGLVLEQNAIPNTAIGTHCFRPYQCDFFGSCWKDHTDEKSIFNLPFINKDKLFEWFNQGIKTIEAVDSESIENSSHARIKDSFLTNMPIINARKIEEFLDGIKAPIAAIDMEIWAPAIPFLPGTRPFQQIPFLFCLTDGSKNDFFLSPYEQDERIEFAKQLIEKTQEYSTLLVYDKTMEELAVKGLKEKVPELAAQLDILKNKFVDLFEVFKNLYYYHPRFRNNFSLKMVSEVFETGVEYTAIQSGLEAMNYFEQYRTADTEENRENLKHQLIDYCLNDARATLALAGCLEKLVKTQ